jgi:CheY-like chemotaxis protein
MNDSRRYTVLLVDDDPNICQTMSMLLNGVGYDVATAMHGIDALNKLRSTAPDLIVSDLHMPQMSGFEFLSVVRDRFPSIPVIAMSGDVHSDGEVPTGVMADAFYGKGRCRPNELLQMVRRLTHAPVARPISPRDHPESKQEPRYRNDPDDAISVLPTCPNCLRSISFELTEEGRNVFRNSAVNLARPRFFMSVAIRPLPFWKVCPRQRMHAA